MSDLGIRVCLFTDTLADVNGVSRFIQNIANVSERSRRSLHVLTSTRLGVPDRTNIMNFRPIVAGAMPRYENLELALPPAQAMMQAAQALRPDAIHISTPGPVGIVGLAAARKLGIPVLGVYHTDFPAYIDHLFDDSALTWMSLASMRLFYGRFAAIFTRSHDYALRLRDLGIPGSRLVRLRPGIDTSRFDPRFRDDHIWARVGLPPEAYKSPKVLYAGRISIEKNLLLLAQAWTMLRRLMGQGSAAVPQLVVVGDGPYRASMAERLSGEGAHFLGFRHGAELSAIYASSDVFAFPSTTDTLGQVVMEAQSSGLPVLVSDRGGPREVVTDGVTGRVLQAGDAAAWAHTMAELIESPDLRSRMGAAGHAAMQAMSIEASFEHFWSVHEGEVRRRST